MITLYSFPALGSLPSLSPFCFKLETYLRLTKRDYKTVYPMTPSGAPKGKLPYIEDGGRVVADSGFIIDYLKATYGDPLDQDMSEAERAVAHAFRRLFEENLYWTLLYERWFVEENWALTKGDVFDKMPAPLRPIVVPIVRRAIRKELVGHGMGRHGTEEIRKIALDDLKAVAAFLGDKPYFMGDKPRTIDATAHAFLGAALFLPIKGPLKAELDKLANLKAYCQRMHQALFGKPLGA
jgi:glutathione S-transferase